MSEHLTESRDDLEQRFLLMGQFVQHGRRLSLDHGSETCPACVAVRDAVPIPFTVLAASQEPREDLEEAVVSINDRLETIALGPEVPGCPVYAFVHSLLASATERLDESAGETP